MSRLDDIVRRLGLARAEEFVLLADEIDQLCERVDVLETQVRSLQVSAPRGIDELWAPFAKEEQ